MVVRSPEVWRDAERVYLGPREFGVGVIGKRLPVGQRIQLIASPVPAFGQAPGEAGVVI
jgi:hypothetical protein